MSTFLQSKRQQFQKEIRRQYIEQFQKTRRRQLQQANQQYYKNCSQTQQKQMIGRTDSTDLDEHNQFSSHFPQDYLNYLNSFSFALFQQDPNSNIQYIIEILNHLKPTTSENIKGMCSQILVAAYQLISSRLALNKEKVQYVKNLMSCQNFIQEDSVFTPLVTLALIYNETFFQPLTVQNKLHFLANNPYNPIQPLKPPYISQEEYRNQPKESEVDLKTISDVKLNLNLVLDLFLLTTYEITIELFAKSMTKKHRQNVERFSNGYDLPIQEQYTFPQFSRNFVNINNFIYDMAMDLITISLNIRHITNSIQSTYNKLQTFYAENHFTKKHQLPTLYFDVHKIFVKESFQHKIIGKGLTLIQNMTSFAGQNAEFDEFLRQKYILNQIESIYDELPFKPDDIRVISAIYANLVEEQIEWFFKQGSLQALRLQIEEESDEFQYPYKQFPSLYLQILDKISDQMEQPEVVNRFVYILMVILKHYNLKAPELKNDVRPKQLHDESHKFLLANECQFQQIADCVTSLFTKIQISQYQVQHLSNLYVRVCEKLLPFILHVHKLPELLANVIKNENKRIGSIEMEIKKSKLNNEIFTEKEERLKQVFEKNVQKIIKETIKVLKMIRRQTKQFDVGSIKFQYIDLTQSEQLPKDLIGEMLNLWIENELQYCFLQFALFIRCAVKYFPQYIVVQNNHEKDEAFISILQDILSNTDEANLRAAFIQTMQHVVNYLNERWNKSGAQQRHQVRNYFITFNNEWHNILQHLEGLMYSSDKGETKFIQENQEKDSNGNEFNKVQQIYQTIESWMKRTQEEMEIQI